MELVACSDKAEQARKTKSNSSICLIIPRFAQELQGEPGWTIEAAGDGCVARDSHISQPDFSRNGAVRGLGFPRCDCRILFPQCESRFAIRTGAHSVSHLSIHHRRASPLRLWMCGSRSRNPALKQPVSHAASEGSVMSGTGKCILAALFVIAIRNSRKAQSCAWMTARTWF